MLQIDNVISSEFVSNYLALAVLVLLIVILTITSTTSNKTRKSFFAILIGLMVASVTNLLTVTATRSNCPYAPYVFISITHAMILMSLTIYIKILTITTDSEQSKNSKTINKLCEGITLFNIAVDSLSCITHLGIYETENGIVINEGASIYSIGFLVLSIIIFVLSLANKSKLFPKARYIIMAESAGTVITVFDNTSTSGVTILLLTLPIITSLCLSRDISYDFYTGALDISGKEHTFNERERKMTIFCFDIYDLMTIPSTTKTKTIFYTFSKKDLKKLRLLKISENRFLIQVYDNEFVTSQRELINTIEKTIGRYIMSLGGDYSITVFNYNKETSQSNLIQTCDYFKEITPKGGYYIASDKDYEAYEKSMYILSELRDIASKKDLNDERIQVYCQPVKNVKRDRYDTAEALMRLRLPKYGLIFPDEFIPLAEKYKYIHIMSLIILNKVCKEAKSLINAGYEFERISVNFATQEFYNYDLAQEIFQIIDDNKLNPQKIAVEITESENERDFEVIKERVKDIKDFGICLYLDDFGSGYSNFDRILDLDVDIIKFDRTFLLMLDESGTKKPLLSYFSEAFDELGYKVLYEGVENNIQEDVCINANASYLQGYKYSKPIPIENLREFFYKAS